MNRRRLIPEVIQTSAMDCGPACLAALLAGYGVSASYERLREACQTDVDGTSIDTIEEAAVQLGLEAVQQIVPVDHVLAVETGALPALAVTRQPDGSNHFVVLWSQVAGRVQVMDPGIGRRWVTRRRLLDELYVHEMDLPADTWREWAAADEFTKPLIRRLAALGISDAASMVEHALADGEWQPIATLDAAARMIAGFVDAGAVHAGATASTLLRTLIADPTTIPAPDWSARATDDPATVRVRGAVLVTIGGFAHVEPVSAELRAALVEPTPRPWRHLFDAITMASRTAPHILICAVLLTVLFAEVQALLWRMLFDANELTNLQLAGALGILVGYLAIELTIEGLLVGGIFRLGRSVEIGLRAQFLAAIGRLGLPYLRSRPISDMAERSHMLHRLRELPWVAARMLRAGLTALATAVALIWIAPDTAPIVIALFFAVIVPPLAAHGALAERELRVRTHSGALTRFYLDALLGVTPARVHGIERPLRREHEGQLVEWARAAERENTFASAILAVQVVLVCGLAIWLVAQHVTSTARPASVLLAVYWVITMQSTGGHLTTMLRELPIYRNLTLRLLEPLGARVEAAPASAPVQLPPGAARLELDGVGVVARGHQLLEGVTLAIDAGEHVAVVGPSGAGKSTLIGLLLGFHVPANGVMTLGGAPLDAAMLASLRRRTVWVDPAVQLWNDSLANNLAFGLDATPDLGATVMGAQLDGVIGRLRDGMQTRLGEGGGLLSAGEGQRVRLGRGVARDGAVLVLLDEPFRGIDRERRRDMLAEARKRWRGTTLLCVTHDLDETRGFDRVIVIDQGRVVEDGAPGDLAEREGSRYAQLLAEEAVANQLWNRWRRVRLDAGRVQESRT